MSVREARPEDAPAVRDLVVQLREGEAEGETRPLDVEWVRGYLTARDVIVLVAEDGGRIAGLLTLEVAPDLYHGGPSAYVNELVVGHEYRERGIGGALLDEALTRARAAGCVEIALSTDPENERAKRLYRSRGFVHESLLLERHFGTEG